MTLFDASANVDDPAMAAARTRAAAVLGITRQLNCGCSGAAPPSDFDVASCNRRRRAPVPEQPEHFAWSVAVDARRPEAAREQMKRARERAAVAIDVFTAGASDLALDTVVRDATGLGLPVRIADPRALKELAQVHRQTAFVLSRPGETPFTGEELAPLAASSNVHVDLASCGAARGALDDALAHFGAARLLWGTGLRMDVALAQLRALEIIAPGAAALDAIRWWNAQRLYLRERAP